MGRICETNTFYAGSESKGVMVDESGESTEKDDVVGEGRD